MTELHALGLALYAFCTDFVINTAALLGLTYQDVNAGLFFIVFPSVTAALVLIASWQAAVLRRLRRELRAIEGASSRAAQ